MRLRLVVPVDVERPTGGNVYDLELADAMRDMGTQVEVVRCDPDDLARTLAEPVEGHTLIDGLLTCRQPDAVAASSAGVIVHMPIALGPGLSPARAVELDALERAALRHASVVLTTSHWSARYLAEHHGLREVAVAQPGCQPAAVSAGSQPPVLVHLAPLMPHKDQLGVVTAMAALVEFQWCLRLAGSVDRDPEYAAAVRDLVRASGLIDRVDIPGEMARDAAWAGADLALLPSRVETFGMVVTEALARGVPAVVSDGGPSEALGLAPSGERPGVVVHPGDTDGLRAALRHWLADEESRVTLRRLALARRDTLDGWDMTARRVQDAIRSALNRRDAAS